MADSNITSTDAVPTYKIILLGEVDAGKTTLFYHVREGRYVSSERYGPGADYCTKKITVDNDVVKIILWDTAGVERFRTLTRNYFRGACAIIFAFSTANKESLQNLVQYVEDADNSAPNALRYLIGCKCDLQHDVNYTDDDAHRFAKAHGCRQVFMTSAKMGRGVDEAIREIARETHTMNKRRRSQDCINEHYGFYATSEEDKNSDTCACSNIG